VSNRMIRFTLPLEATGNDNFNGNSFR
jgi:hypothetical protein